MDSATSDVRRFRSADLPPDRHEDPHIEPYVEVRKLSREPSIREVTFPPNGRLDRERSSCRAPPDRGLAT